MKRSKWFEGFIWAESIYKTHALDHKRVEFEIDNRYDEACCFGDVTDFDRGARDYTILMRERDEKLR